MYLRGCLHTARFSVYSRDSPFSLKSTHSPWICLPIVLPIYLFHSVHLGNATYLSHSNYRGLDEEEHATHPSQHPFCHVKLLLMCFQSCKTDGGVVVITIVFVVIIIIVFVVIIIIVFVVIIIIVFVVIIIFVFVVIIIIVFVVIIFLLSPLMCL